MISDRDSSVASSMEIVPPIINLNLQSDIAKSLFLILCIMQGDADVTDAYLCTIGFFNCHTCFRDVQEPCAPQGVRYWKIKLGVFFYENQDFIKSFLSGAVVALLCSHIMYERLVHSRHIEMLKLVRAQ